MRSHKFENTKNFATTAIELLISIFPIFIGDLLLVFIFMHLGKESLSVLFFAYAFLEAASTYLIGKISDIWSRKNILILVHCLAVIPLCFLYYYKDNIKDHIYYLLVAGLLFSPAPAARALLIDNFKSTIARFPKNNLYKSLYLTETRLIGISWLVQYFPWILSPILAVFNKGYYLLTIIFLMAMLVPLMYYCLSEMLENKKHSPQEKLSKSFSRSPYTLAALLLAQIVFWGIFDKIDFLQNSADLFFLVGIGAFLGTFLSLFYPKTPHLSAVNISYGFGVMLSITCLIYYSFYANANIPLGLQLIQIAAVGGFYLPFVYDMVVTEGGAGRRGTMFACAEVVQSIASVIGMVMMTLIGDRSILLFSLTTFLFLGAYHLQLKKR